MIANFFISETRDDNEAEVEDTDAMDGIPTLPSRPDILKETTENGRGENSVDLVFDDSEALNRNTTEEIPTVPSGLNSNGPSVEIHYEDSEEVSSMSTA